MKLMCLIQGEDPHRLALRENTALWQAAKDGDLPAVEAALDAGACLDVHVGKFGTTPLQEAAGAGHEHIVRFLLQRGADVNAQSSQGSTALFRAAIFRHGGVVRILAAEGADLEVRRGFDGATALVAAAAFVGNAEIVGVLIDVGADVDAANDAGSTALFLAAQHGDEETVAVLINGGADVDKARSNGATPLVIAAQEGTPGVIRLLLDAGADPTIANNFRTTPLHLTGFRLGGVGEEMAGMLLASAFNVDIDAMDEDGRTPLMWAARFGNAGVARFLLEEGADGSAVDGAGRSAAALVCTCVENEGDMAKLQCPSSGCELPATASEVLEALRQ
ncbi:unnamed protein product [Ostreobium quekettii]|uniref:Ankyrin repeat domain-containing protein n=1 Tax=Ostreobium quekettii TaxID=121088 RepID=A0A8S1INM7_9CHLO|nr:unnamed protein product [Ostreobium quekettii]